jgi:hypothetical protein
MTMRKTYLEEVYLFAAAELEECLGMDEHPGGCEAILNAAHVLVRPDYRHEGTIKRWQGVRDAATDAFEVVFMPADKNQNHYWFGLRAWANTTTIRRNCRHRMYALLLMWAMAREAGV